LRQGSTWSALTARWLRWAVGERRDALTAHRVACRCVLLHLGTACAAVPHPPLAGLRRPTQSTIDAHAQRHAGPQQPCHSPQTLLATWLRTSLFKLAASSLGAARYIFCDCDCRARCATRRTEHAHDTTVFPAHSLDPTHSLYRCSDPPST
jgi:hypothetical protein